MCYTFTPTTQWAGKKLKMKEKLRALILLENMESVIAVTRDLRV